MGRKTTGVSAAVLIFMGLLTAVGAARAQVSWEYEVVALRRASDVAGGPEDASAQGFLGRTLTIGPTLTWLDGRDCGDWSLRDADGPVVFLGDPLLSDTQVGPPNGDPPWPDHRVNASLEVLCEDEVLGALLRVDNRVLVMPSASGLTNMVLERALDKGQVRTLQSQLKSMKFYDGEASGRLDRETRRAAAFYAQYLGADYAFEGAAITENLLEGLRILTEEPTPFDSGETALEELKVVYYGPVAAHFLGVAEPLMPLTYGVRELWFGFEGDPERYRFEPEGALSFADWYFDHLFSPEGTYVLLPQDRFGPYHVVRVSRLGDYLAGRTAPDQVVGYEPEEGSPRGVHGEAKWLSEEEIEYTVTCCGEPMVRVETVEDRGADSGYRPKTSPDTVLDVNGGAIRGHGAE